MPWQACGGQRTTYRVLSFWHVGPRNYTRVAELHGRHIILWATSQALTLILRQYLSGSYLMIFQASWNNSFQAILFSLSLSASCLIVGTLRSQTHATTFGFLSDMCVFHTLSHFIGPRRDHF